MFPDEPDLYEKIMQIQENALSKSKISNVTNNNRSKSGFKYNPKDSKLNQSLGSNKSNRAENKSNSKARKPMFVSEEINALESGIPLNNEKGSFIEDELAENSKSRSKERLNSENENSSKNKHKDIAKEAEIQKKLETFKKKLHNELYKVLSEERLKDEERELLYQKTKNETEKKRLEKIISMERAQSSERIFQVNE